MTKTHEQEIKTLLATHDSKRNVMAAQHALRRKIIENSLLAEQRRV